MTREGWGKSVSVVITGKYNVSHYFIKNQTETLCGHTSIGVLEKIEVDFDQNGRRHCKSCNRSLPYWKENGEKKVETDERKQDAYFAQFNEPKKIKISSPTFWIEAVCSHIDKNGKRCTAKGVYPTSDPEAAKNHDHYCLIHNLRVKGVMAA